MKAKPEKNSTSLSVSAPTKYGKLKWCTYQLKARIKFRETVGIVHYTCSSEAIQTIFPLSVWNQTKKKINLFFGESVLSIIFWEWLLKTSGGIADILNSWSLRWKNTRQELSWSWKNSQAWIFVEVGIQET